MKNFTLSFFIILSTLLLSGCVSTRAKLLSESSSGLRPGDSLAVSIRPMPSFAVFKPSNAMFGAIGGIASISSGNDIIRKNTVADPAVYISEVLAAHLVAKFNVSLVNEKILIDTTNVSAISEIAKETSELVLDVQTANWSCVYMPLNWTRYRVIYSAKVRLIDTRRSESIAEGLIIWQTPDSYDKPTYEELFSNNALILVDQLKIAKDQAVIYFKSEILN